MDRNNMQVQLDKRTIEGKDHWVMSYTPESVRRQLDPDGRTYVLIIDHDWSSEPDRYSYQRWEDGQEHQLLPLEPITETDEWDLLFDEAREQYDSWNDDPQFEGELFPYEPMTDAAAKIFKRMIARWEALNMLAVFSVTW